MTQKLIVGDLVTHRLFSVPREVVHVYLREHLPGDGAASEWVAVVAGVSDRVSAFRLVRRTEYDYGF